MQSRHKTAASPVRLALMALLFTAATVFAQGHVTTVEDSGFEKRTRPVVAFEHDAHNQKAEIYDCAVCHHFYENGEKREGQMSVGMECSECHLSENNGRMELTRAYHRMCKTCHLEKRAGPVQCAQCHSRQNSPAK